MKPICISWIDSHEADGWCELADFGSQEGKLIKTIGFVVGETETSISIAHSVAGDPDQACGIITIPKLSIIGKQEVCVAP